MNYKWNLRTDLAYDTAKDFEEKNINGLIERRAYFNDILVIEHHINTVASLKLNKKAGTYFTIDLSNINYHDQKTAEKIEKTLAMVIKDMLKIYHLENKKCLVIGLGNENITPDALGPLVIDNLVVTRHVAAMQKLNDNYGIVSALSPGVMGNTGIETYDVIEAIKNKIDIDYLIVVDALASSRMARLNKTIQITDTGIHPGAGVGNFRKEISMKTMHMPVIAVGIPTVVDAVSIVYETLNYATKYFSLEYDKVPVEKATKLDYTKIEEPNAKLKEHFSGIFGMLDENGQKHFLEKVLSSNGQNMMVTSKDIDEEIYDLSKIVGWGINKALHKSIYNNTDI